ncbi:MAG: bifunctional metallophosphatase/5'-nucleotidase [Candidatus Krumholzibacteriia bacterium]
MSFKGRRLFAAAGLWILVAAGLAFAQAAPVPGPGPYDLTIYHTNDAHGGFVPEPAQWRDDKASVGGIVALAAHLARERLDGPPSLVLDAGDFMTGNILCDLAENGVVGAGWQRLRNFVGYDVGVVGNHEFDQGRDNALALAALANYPIIAADILDEQGRTLFPAGPLVIARGDLRVGIIGVSCADLFAVTSPARTGGLSLRNQETVVREQLADLLPRTDLQVLISHSGVQADEALAKKLAGSGLDVIVGSHSHTRLKEPKLVGDILIVQAGSGLKNLGRLDLAVKDGRVVRYDGRLIELTADDPTGAPPELVALAAADARRIDDEFGRTIGTLVTPWTRRGDGGSNLGNWITDALRARAGADVAFLNSGSIRKDLPAGPIRLRDVKEILPFANTLVTWELSGRDLLHIAETNVQSTGGHDGGLQMSGLTYGWRRVGDHIEVEDVRVGGHPLKLGRTYKAAAADYVCLQAKEYLGCAPPQTTCVGIGVTDAVAEAIRRAGRIEARPEVRVRELRGPEPRRRDRSR